MNLNELSWVPSSTRCVALGGASVCESSQKHSLGEKGSATLGPPLCAWCALDAIRQVCLEEGWLPAILKGLGPWCPQ